MTSPKPNGQDRLQATHAGQASESSTTIGTSTGEMSGSSTAFFYGTLMAPEVFYSVIYGRSKPGEAYESLHTFHPAILDGYVRKHVAYADYPGITAAEGQSVRGVYVTGLTSANMWRLDVFEGSEYDKREVKLKLLDTDEEKEATAYVYRKPEDLMEGEWDFEHFKKEKLARWSR